METLIPLSGVEALILAFAALTAGTVRGFTGFGTALIFMPLAGIVLEPVTAVATLVLMDIVGPLPMLPRAAPHVHRKDLIRLLAGTLLALPLGLAALFVMQPTAFRILVSAISLAMLAGLILGWRYSGPLRPRAVVGTGAAAGFLGGIAGIPGPPVIFVYMASAHPPPVIRANITFYLLGYDWILVAMLAVAGRLDGPVVLIGLLLVIPNMAGTLLGTALFVPGYERVYRLAAYTIILGAALVGLPLWEGRA